MAPRVVYDTNIYISIFAFPGKPVGRLLDLALLRTVDLHVCPFILEEFKRVATFKFHFSPEETTLFEDRILGAATLVHPSERVSIIKAHEDDNKILECANEARAHYLVTGDRRHILPLKNFRRTRIISPSNFAEMFVGILE